VAARSDVPRSSEEGRAFLPWRVAGFGRILGALVLGFYVFANAAGALHPLATWRDLDRTLEGRPGLTRSATQERSAEEEERR